MMIKNLLTILFVLLFCSSVNAQTGFPQAWEGNWKGELSWWTGNAKEPKKVTMELRIHPTDSAHIWSWQIIYGNETQDNRPYKLIAKDTAMGHWIIDENNGILLDQFFIANKFSGAFTVQNSTIVNNYWLENGKLAVEFHSMIAKPASTTGKGTEDSPLVNSYKMKSYQKALLERLK